MLKALTIPISFVVIYLVYVLLWRIFGLPSVGELTQIIERSFLEYGLWIVLVSAFIEGVLLLGQYFPGGFVIFLGVIASRGDIVRAAEVVGIVSIAFFAAYYVNYLLGKYGWYRLFAKFGLGGSIDRAKDKLNKHIFFAVFSNYWDTNIASIIATAAGVLRIPLGKFLLYSVFGIVIWNTVWGVVVYNIGELLIKNELMVSLWVLLVWMLVIIFRIFFWERIRGGFRSSKIEGQG